MENLSNPWLQLPDSAPYILPSDLTQVTSYNQKTDDMFKIVTNTLPEPYIGNLDDAKIILLNLNPGHDENVTIWHGREDFIQENRKNLLFQSNPPFYLLNHRFENSGGFKWWKQKLKELLDIFGIEKVAKDVMCIEYFPYPSKKYKRAQILPSQLYSFHIVEEAIRLNKKIIIMRSRKLWIDAVPSLADYQYVTLKSSQNPCISRNNLPDGEFEKLISYLKSS